MMKKYWWVIALVVLLGVGVWYYMTKDKPEVMPPPALGAKKLSADDVVLWKQKAASAIKALTDGYTAKTGLFADTASGQSDMYKKFTQKIGEGATLEQVAVLEQSWIEREWRKKNGEAELDYTSVFESYNIPTALYKTL